MGDFLNHIMHLFADITFRFGVHEHQGQFHGDVTEGPRNQPVRKGFKHTLFGIMTLLTLL